jgi:hypothetical protein
MTDWYKIKRILVWQWWQEKQVYPAGWKPWANTVAYYPLTSNFNDASWNSRNLTNTNVSTTTLSWVLCAYFNGSNSYLTYSWFALWNTARTINLWLNYIRPNSSSDRLWIIHIANPSANTQASLYWSLWSQIKTSTTICTADWYNSSAESQTATISSWLWYNLVITQEWTTVKLYLNWDLKFTISSYPNQQAAPSWRRLWASCRSIDINQYFKWYLSSVILENKVWSTDDIANYYNQTKSNYWL